jgi:6-pyruvoyltetrahydropterin/6-carboxytetrahydropterin synthase
MILVKEFKFDSAHNLVNYNGKCEKLHGHTYKLVVKIKGTPDQNGLLIDFVDLKRIVNDEIIEVLDHKYLNEIIEQPTAENIAVWVWNRLKDKIELPNGQLHEIEIWETATSGVIYNGDE